MLRQSSELTGYEIHATDGTIGSVVDFLVDDQHWNLRWAVVDTGEWLTGRQVLLPLSVLEPPDSALLQIPVDLTREQVRNSPQIDTDEPVSRRRETEIYDYYGWIPYWYPAINPIVGAPPSEASPPSPDDFGRNQGGDPHLRSIGELIHYYVQAQDGDIGHVEDFLVDVDHWNVRYLVLDTANWWSGRMLIVPTRWIDAVDFDDEAIRLERTRQQIETSPEYRPSQVMERDCEDRLHRHFHGGSNASS
jgi:hypothetical protein